ncbi:MAG: response regulator, partial [Lachnospiraceae bacterium]
MINVYIVDDEVWITLGLKKLLEKLDMDIYVVGTANNGLTAREEIELFKPDVVFTDIRMPGLTGLELLRAVSEVSPDTKVVMISGYAEFSYAKEAVKHHAYDYLLKPIKEEELSRVMISIINESGEEKAEKSEEPSFDRVIDN